MKTSIDYNKIENISTANINGKLIKPSFFDKVISKVTPTEKYWFKTLLKLCLEFIIITFCIYTIVFALVNIGFSADSPPIVSQAIENKAPEATILSYQTYLGVDKSWMTRYASSWSNVFNGSFGPSWTTLGVTTSSIVGSKIVLSLSIGFIAFGFSIILGIPLGVILARRKGSVANWVSVLVTLIAFSVPSFVVGLIFVMISYSFNFPTIFEFGSAFALLIPAIAIAIPLGFGYSRYLRSSIQSDEKKQYVTLAKMKGLSNQKVLWKHTMRSALIPIVTYFPLIMIGVVFGTVTIETVFSIPGSGKALVDAATTGDQNVILMITFFYCIVVIASFFVRDILLGLLDPKLRGGNK